jgi:hypothetical protein
MTTAEVPWPWPGDTETDKARRICWDYRRELRRLNPELCDRMDAAARRLGQHWVAPQPATLDLNAALPAAEMARYLNHEVTADQIRQWGTRHAQGRPGVPRLTNRRGHTVYRLGDILDHLAQQRRARAERTRHG